MDLVAVGAQDLFLTSKPTITFFQSVYKRATPFAMETMEQVVNGTVSKGGRVSVTIARNGDLIGPMYLEAKTQAAAANKPWVAENLVKSIELTIGGQRIDRHYAKWFRLYSELHMNDEKKASYAKLTSTSADSGKVILPLQFFFNRNPGQYLALVALQYHEVRLDIDLGDSFGANEYFDTSGFKVWGTYVFLDTEERKRYAGAQHEILMEQVQHTGADTVSAGGDTVRLSFNHPVKELVWCFSNGGDTAAITNNTDSLTVSDGNDVSIVPHHAGAVVTGASPLDETTVGVLSTMKLMLNGQDRAKEQDAKYFNQLMPYTYYEGTPTAGVYAYPFALRPGDSIQPSGSCNFSRIDNAQVQFGNLRESAWTTLNMFAVNWNVLRISSGLGGLAFSN